MTGKDRNGFTFIEILVVISVFSIGVFAVIRLLSSNLINMESIKTKNSAVFLAKESMEIVYNLKNSNLYKGLKWDCVLDDNIDSNLTIIGNVDNVCKYLFSSGIIDSKVFKIGFESQGYFDISQFDEGTFEQNFDNGLIYYYTGVIGGKKISWYGYSGFNYPGTKTKFARYTKFKTIKESDKELPMDKIVKIESHVLFKMGTKTGNVVLESFISAY